MIKVKDVLDYLENLYPKNTACDFDNVGLLVGNSELEITGAVVALDCDINTVHYAESRNANLIITHHPIILEPLKTLTENDIVFMLIERGISVISMHTNHDVGIGGVNDSLCEALKLNNIKPHIAEDGYLLKYGVTDISDADKFAAHIKEQLGGAVRYVAGSRPVNTVLVCSGSGGNYVDEAKKHGFDALVTADIKHHQFIAAVNAGISLFDGGHYNTENVVVKPLAERLSGQFAGVVFNIFLNEAIKTL